MLLFFFCKQKTAYEMRISDWSADVCSSDLSYLSYLRDRFLLSRDLLTPSGSIFVQISDDNAHMVRNVLDEVFGAENFVITIPFKKKGNQKGKLLDPVDRKSVV